MNAIVLASLAALSAAPQTADTVTLTVDWPAGLVMQANTMVTVSQSQGGQETPEQSGEVKFNLSVTEHPQGVLVSTEVDAGPLPPGVTLPPEPAYIIGDDGGFVGVDQLDTLVQQLRDQAIAQMNAQAGGAGLPPEALAMLDDLINPEAIEGMSRQEYQLMGGLWHGRNFDRNEVQLQQGVFPDPFTQSMVPTEYELIWRGYAPCAEGEPENSCVQLDLAAFPDGDELATTLEAFFGESAGAPGMLIVETAEIRGQVRILAETGSLIPRRVEESVETVVNLSAEGEVIDIVIKQTENTDYTRASGMQR